MGSHVLDPAEIEPTPDYPCERHGISDAVGLDSLAAATYEIAPGERLPRTYHYHDHREELFAVLDGTLTVETPEEAYGVAAGEVFVAEPEQPHLAHVPEDADGPARVLGVGAPLYDPARPYDPAGNGESDETGTTE